MIKRRTFPKIFPGWWIVLTGGILCLWGHGYHTYGFSALFKPISSELGFSRAVTSVAASIGRLEGGFEGPLAGWITDKFGPRWIITFGVFLIGLGLILMNFINSLWAYYVVWGVILGTGNNIATTIPLDTAITNWFVKKRGVALGVKWVFNGLAGTLVLPLIAWLIIIQDWRMACLIGGGVMWLIGLPLAWFFLKQHRPEYYGLLPDGATTEAELEEDAGRMIDRGVKYAGEVQEVEFTLRQAMRTPAYWLLLVAQAAYAMAAPVLIIHVIPLLTDMGIDPLRAAVIVATVTAVTLPAMFISGLLADHAKKQHLRFLLGGTYLLVAVAFAIFLLNQTIAMVYVFLILYYIGCRLGFPLSPAILARYFGRKAFGSIRGTLVMIMTPFGVIAPIYAGWVYDTTNSYITAFALFAALLAFAAVVASLAFPPKPPAEVTDIHKFI